MRKNDGRRWTKSIGKAFWGWGPESYVDIWVIRIGYWRGFELSWICSRDFDLSGELYVSIVRPKASRKLPQPPNANSCKQSLDRPPQPFGTHEPSNIDGAWVNNGRRYGIRLTNAIFRL